MSKRLAAIGLIFLFAVATLGLTACHPSKPSADIRFAVAQAPLNLDPRYATDAASERVNRLLYRSLIDFDASSRPVPALASWQQLSPLHYRFHLLQAGRSFHNGEALTADDVAMTYQSLLALRDSPHRAEFAYIRRVQAVDSDTVDFELVRADSGFVARLVIGILPASLIRQQHDFAHHPVGSGPLKLLSWGSVLKLQRVSDGQRISIVEVKDPTVRVLKLQRGEVDVLQGDLQPELVAYLKQQQGIQVSESAGSNFSYLGFNLQDKTLANVQVRQAIAHAIDRDAIIRKAMVGGTRPAGAILPPEHWAGNASLQAYQYDPALARKLLQQAGVALPLTLVYKTSTDAQRVRLATMMQAQMLPAGIQLEIHSLDWGTFFGDIKQGKFQLSGLTWVGIRTPEIYRLAFHTQSVPPGGANRGHYMDAVLDKLLEKEDWPAATARIHEQLPYIPLWYEGQFVAMRAGLHHYQLQADGNWDGLATLTRD